MNTLNVEILQHLLTREAKVHHKNIALDFNLSSVSQSSARKRIRKTLNPSLPHQNSSISWRSTEASLFRAWQLVQMLKVIHKNSSASIFFLLDTKTRRLLFQSKKKHYRHCCMRQSNNRDSVWLNSKSEKPARQLWGDDRLYNSPWYCENSFPCQILGFKMINSPSFRTAENIHYSFFLQNMHKGFACRLFIFIFR